MTGNIYIWSHSPRRIANSGCTFCKTFLNTSKSVCPFVCRICQRSSTASSREFLLLLLIPSMSLKSKTPECSKSGNRFAGSSAFLSSRQARFKISLYLLPTLISFWLASFPAGKSNIHFKFDYGLILSLFLSRTTFYKNLAISTVTLRVRLQN